MIHNPHLEGDPFFWKAGPTGILLIHGFTATVAEVRPLAKNLNAAGFTVAAPLLPGHNTKPEDLNRVHWQDWIAAGEAMYSQLQPQCERVVVGGESTGGLISLYLATIHPEIAACLLYAPALRLTMRPIDKLMLHLMSPVKPWVPKANLDSNALWQGYPVNPLKGVIQLLKLQKIVYPMLEKVRQPLLIIQGRQDKTVHPSVPDEIYHRVSSPTKEIHWMENSAHCVILDIELDHVTQITLSFLKCISA